MPDEQTPQDVCGAATKNLFPGFSPTLSRGESWERGWLKTLPLLPCVQEIEECTEGERGKRSEEF